MQYPKLLICDIDGTLISHLSDEKKVILRPGLKDFLSGVRKLGYEIALWSASSKEWVSYVSSTLNEKFVFEWYGNRCSRRMNFEGELIIRKRLKKVWIRYKKKYNRTNTLILDDTPSTYAENRGNGIRIEPYYDGEDNELERVLGILKYKAESQDVRFSK